MSGFSRLSNYTPKHSAQNTLLATLFLKGTFECGLLIRQ